ncbi:MAG: urease accessory protein UreD [Methylococcaceae bacterium]|nr:urease accessory protein UreD [Methylococcaceae bacterium]
MVSENWQAKGWQADLQLGFAQSRDKTLLVKRQHYGPLTVQRPFYPEGGVCHVYILHPPGGIVAGDNLCIKLKADPKSHALITTPAAGKFYRSSGAQATQLITMQVENDATLEWLPQDTIIYQGAQLRTINRIDLAKDARFIGWEILSLGRPASAESFNTGQADVSWQIYKQDKAVFLERLLLDAKAFHARWGLQGHSACGTLFACPASQQTLSAIQQFIGDRVGYGVTRIDDLLVCRGMDSRSDRLRTFFEQAWAIVRPDTARRQLCVPRIWAT